MHSSTVPGTAQTNHHSSSMYLSDGCSADLRINLKIILNVVLVRIHSIRVKFLNIYIKSLFFGRSLRTSLTACP